MFERSAKEIVYEQRKARICRKKGRICRTGKRIET